MEMAVCEAYRISHSHFLGGPDEWTQLDRDKAIWWQARQASVCQSCGTRPAEWDETEGGHPHAYKTEIAHCRGCQTRTIADERFEKNRKKHRRGSYVRLIRNPEVP
jgi:hypothetical protein